MDTLWSPCSRSASAVWLLVGSRWPRELFLEQVIFLESVVVDPLQAEAAAEDLRGDWTLISVSHSGCSGGRGGGGFRS